jgi:hypothetical protein
MVFKDKRYRFQREKKGTIKGSNSMPDIRESVQYLESKA